MTMTQVQLLDVLRAADAFCMGVVGFVVSKTRCYFVFSVFRIA
jgi:hypothetical protein